ncbi:ATP-binding protein [Streptomyces sp. PsTaAH-124]|uniref:ATP-binding protein n=1 Tax=Streptomyces sp. PsTaAH-124 TaxID=1157638 RepID=UPI00035E0AA0|nr:ATP-binding protein [Streptomyces sp. PsTaAH-124]
MQLEIRPDPAEVGRARRWARSRLAGSGIAADEPLAETLVLLVSELVTNAVVHTGCPAVLRLSLPGTAAGAATVRLEVADASACAPVPRCAGDEATGGRGLALVDGLADRWGWSAEGAGKRIWCELDRCPPPVASVTARPAGCGGQAPLCDGTGLDAAAWQAPAYRAAARPNGADHEGVVHGALRYQAV